MAVKKVLYCSLNSTRDVPAIEPCPVKKLNSSLIFCLAPSAVEKASKKLFIESPPVFEASVICFAKFPIALTIPSNPGKAKAKASPTFIPNR